MRKIIITIMTFITLVFSMAALTVPVSADTVNVFNGAACQGNNTVCGKKGSTNPVYTIIQNVINLLLYAAGIIAVIMIIIGAISYVLSGGDQARITSAKNTILYAVIGLVVAMLAFAIVNFVVVRIF